MPLARDGPVWLGTRAWRMCRRHPVRFCPPNLRGSRPHSGVSSSTHVGAAPDSEEEGTTGVTDRVGSPSVSRAESYGHLRFDRSPSCLWWVAGTPVDTNLCRYSTSSVSVRGPRKSREGRMGVSTRAGDPRLRGSLTENAWEEDFYRTGRHGKEVVDLQYGGSVLGLRTNLSGWESTGKGTEPSRSASSSQGWSTGSATVCCTST